jgi:alpha-D-ribose 1-methylphosphonate 5-triphosphate diphosphatase
MDKFEEEQMALAAAWSQPNRQRIAAICRERNIALASHDDATCEHVLESRQLGSVIAEFPPPSPSAGVAPARDERSDGRAEYRARRFALGQRRRPPSGGQRPAGYSLSDYYPASLLDAAFRIADDEGNAFTLAQAIRLVSKNPAQALGLHDRGAIAEGKRADLVLARRRGEHIHIDHVWRQGKRVF